MRTKGWSAALVVLLLASACNQSKQDAGTTAEAAKPAAAPAPGDAAKSDVKRRIFVSNYQVDTISVLEGDPEMEVRTIPGGDSPHGLAIRPTEPRLLAVAQSTGFGVKFIDPDTLEEKGYVETSRGPQHVKFSPDGKRLYVLSPLAFTVHVIDVDAMKVDGEPMRFEKRPKRLVVDGPRNRIYVLLDVAGPDAGAEVAVIDPATREVVKRVPVDKHPEDMALGNNGRTLATASFDNSTITVIDAESLEVVATHPARTGMGLAVHPSKPIAYSSESFDDTIQVLDLETGKSIAETSAGRWPTYPAFGPDGRFLYVPHEESDSLVKIDTETNQIVGKAVVGQAPVEVVVYEP